MKHLGIMGGGGISDTHARAAREIEGLQVAAFYGDNPEKTAQLAERYGGTVYRDLESFLAHDALDLVIIGSPSALHAQQGIAAARRGLHVLTEKPIDVTTAQADALIKECERAQVKLGVCFQDRVAPDIARLKQLIDAGRIGKPIVCSGHVKWYRPPEYYANSRWRGRRALDGGGALMNQGVHTIDLLLWLLGDVERVYARTLTALHTIEVEDTVVATLEFRNGAVGTVEAATSIYPGYQRRVEVSGREGTIIMEHDRIVKADLRTPDPTLVTPSAGDSNASASSPIVTDVSGHRRLIEDFLQAIETGGRPICDGAEGRRSVELIEAIYESSRRGLPVSLSAT
ncbi:MAG TPA: Gfo/Idh/MocA family oxidoreductase [Pyrinomonadaceae bacterium]|nr:Gfo/Idh/MocA family oxidoreductase [Pyrinomonadaceae bacterium]